MEEADNHILSNITDLSKVGKKVVAISECGGSTKASSKEKTSFLSKGQLPGLKFSLGASLKARMGGIPAQPKS